MSDNEKEPVKDQFDDEEVRLIDTPFHHNLLNKSAFCRSIFQS